MGAVQNYLQQNATSITEKQPGSLLYNRVRTSSEIKKSRVFQVLPFFFQNFSRALEVQNESNIHNKFFLKNNI